MASGDTQLSSHGTESESGSHLQDLRPSCSLFYLPSLLSPLLPLRLCLSSQLVAGNSPTGESSHSAVLETSEPWRTGRVRGRGSVGSEKTFRRRKCSSHCWPSRAAPAPWLWLTLYQSCHMLSWASSLVYKEKKVPLLLTSKRLTRSTFLPC